MSYIEHLEESYSFADMMSMYSTAPADWVKCCIAMTSYKHIHACGNIFNTITTGGHSSLEKYTSHTLFEMVGKGYKRLCVRGELETEQRLQHIDPPSSSGHSSASFSFSCAAQPGAWGPSSRLRVGSHSSIWNHWLQALNSNCLTSCLTQVISLFDTHLLLVDVTSAPNSTRPQLRLSPDIFDRMHLLFAQVHFLFWQLGRGISNINKIGHQLLILDTNT